MTQPRFVFGVLNMTDQHMDDVTIQANSTTQPRFVVGELNMTDQDMDDVTTEANSTTQRRLDTNASKTPTNDVTIEANSMTQPRLDTNASKTPTNGAPNQDSSSPSVFRVPTSLKETNQYSYTPQKLGLGPYHHLRLELRTMGRQKLAVVKNLLNQNSKPKNFSIDFLEKMTSLVPGIREIYDKYLDLEGSSLDYIIAVDSLYLLDFLSGYDEGTMAENLDPDRRELAKDVVILENQIPAFALAEMGKELDLFNPERGIEETMLFSQLFYNFCKAHSPLEVAELWGNRRSQSSHLLAHMYNLIVNNRGAKESETMHKRTRLSRITELGTEVLTGAVVKPLLFAFVSLKVWENSKLSEEVAKVKEEKPKIEKIQIPSAVELSEKHNVDFKLLERGGIRDIEIKVEGLKHTLHLLKIAFRYDSETVIRNLVAYEAAIATPESTLELAEYVDLMCGLVHTHKDVVFLRGKGIVSGDLSNEQVVEIFNGINRSMGKSKEVSASQRVVNQVKEMLRKNARIRRHGRERRNSSRKKLGREPRFLGSLLRLL